MLSVFHNRRWDGDFMTVKKIIDSQTLGRLVEVESHYDRYRPQVDSGTWKETKEKGAGILYNLGSHIIDQALCLFGMPQAVQALVGIQRTGGIADDYYDIKLLYAQHHVILKSSYLVRELGPRYVLLGEKGTFVKYGIDPQEQLLKDGIMPGVAGWGMDEEHLWGTLNTTLDGLHIQGAVETMAGNYSGFYDSVYNHIRGGQPLAVSAQDGLAVIAVIELAEQSSRERRTVSLS